MAIQDDDFDVKASYEELSANLMQPNKFAKIFCEAAREQKSIDKILAGIIKRLIKEDVQVIGLLKAYQRQVNKEDLLSLIKKIGFSGYTIIVAVITATIIVIVKKFI